MKKFLAMLGTGLSSVLAFAEGSAVTAYTPSTAQNTDVVTGTGGVLQTAADYIASVASNAWPVIVAIVGVGLLIWLGRAILRAVRAYFSTAM